MTEQSQRALGDVRVLDLTNESGLYCTKLLADLGADVIKIEPPGGDPTRSIGPFLNDEPSPERSLFFFHFNTNKRSITLDIETRDGQEIFRRLAATADVIVETFSPGYLDDRCIGYEALHSLNPRLIVTSITPFGQRGPYRNYPATDLTALALGGVLLECGWPDRPPVTLGALQAYHQVGGQAATGTLVALLARDATDAGQHVDVSIQASMPVCLLTRIPTFMATGDYEGRGGDIHRSSLNGVFPCRDGYVDIRFRPRAGRWQRVLQWIVEAGMAQDLTDEKYVEFKYRSVPENAQHIDAVFREFFMTMGKEELMDTAQRNGFEVGAIYTAEDLLRDPQLVARRFFVDVEHQDLDRNLTYTGSPYRHSETPWSISRRPPNIGEHTGSILGEELGLGSAELLTLKRTGVI
ncbi:MAG TPA: CoA transferase [Chloroflexota bacterium]|nr:CoA transferase [Chloroflexota bacterium]